MARASLSRRLLPDGRLHLQEGPIDLVIEAFGDPAAVRRAYDAAAACFEDVLPGLVAELPALRRALDDGTLEFEGPVARRMAAACRPHRANHVTPMAAVAGAVADHVLAAMTAAAELSRAYVNDGGDIALHLAPGESLACGMVAQVADPRLDGRAVVTSDIPVRGIATSGRAASGQGGRSFSLGIADAVTVFARSAAAADVAATLIANAVDLPGHERIQRRPATELDPDSDLGDRLVTVGVGDLSAEDVAAALGRGQGVAAEMRAAGLIEAAALFLRGQAEVMGGEGLLPPADVCRDHASGATPQLSPSGLPARSRSGFASAKAGLTRGSMDGPGARPLPWIPARTRWRSLGRDDNMGEPDRRVNCRSSRFEERTWRS